MERANPFITALMLLIAASLAPDPAAAKALQAFVSILPQRYFVEKIAGPAVKVSVMVAPHQNPEHFEPLPAQMAALSKADAYFAIGVPFEDTWLRKFAAACPGLRLIRTDAGIHKKPIHRHDINHPAGPADTSHSPGGLDPHVWLSPALVMNQARHIRDAFIDLDPGRAAVYEANFKKFAEELTLLDRQIRDILAAAQGNKKFLVLHPSWGYFADDYGLTQLSIEMEGKEPKAREVRQLIDYAARHHIRTVFVQPQFSARQAEIIAREMGGRLEALDPLAAEWHANLLKTARAISASFDQTPR